MAKKNHSDLILLPTEEIAKMAPTDVKPQELLDGKPELIKLTTGKKMIEGQFYYKDIKGILKNGDLRFENCWVQYWNRLLLPNGTPLSAKSLAYFFSGIQWKAGLGWPIYSTRCPLSDTSPAMLFPRAKRHQLIVQFGGFYWPECANSNAGVGKEITDVFVGVNDDNFKDNSGGFAFVVSAYGV